MKYRMSFDVEADSARGAFEKLGPIKNAFEKLGPARTTFEKLGPARINYSSRVVLRTN